MQIIELINALRSGDKEIIFSVSDDAADALEIMDERLSIMGEVLTAKEWEATETEARQRVKAGKAETAERAGE